MDQTVTQAVVVLTSLEIKSSLSEIKTRPSEKKPWDQNLYCIEQGIETCRMQTLGEIKI